MQEKIAITTVLFILLSFGCGSGPSGKSLSGNESSGGTIDASNSESGKKRDDQIVTDRCDQRKYRSNAIEICYEYEQHVSVRTSQKRQCEGSSDHLYVPDAACIVPSGSLGCELDYGGRRIRTWYITFPMSSVQIQSWCKQTGQSLLIK